MKDFFGREPVMTPAKKLDTLSAAIRFGWREARSICPATSDFIRGVERQYLLRGALTDAQARRVEEIYKEVFS